MPLAFYARSATEAFRVQVDSARAARDGLAREQAQGLRTQLEVLQAEQQLLDAELGLANARRDATVAAYRVLAVTGQLSAQSLNLPTTPYDPSSYREAVAGKLWDGKAIHEAYLGGPHG